MYNDEILGNLVLEFESNDDIWKVNVFFIDYCYPSSHSSSSQFQECHSTDDISNNDIISNESNPSGNMCLSWLLYEWQPMRMILFQLLIYNKLNTSTDESIISTAYLKWINLDIFDIVINNRQFYQRKKNVWHQLRLFDGVINVNSWSILFLVLLIIILSTDWMTCIKFFNWLIERVIQIICMVIKTSNCITITFLLVFLMLLCIKNNFYQRFLWLD